MLNMFNFKKNREKQMKQLKNLRKEAKYQMKFKVAKKKLNPEHCIA